VDVRAMLAHDMTRDLAISDFSDCALELILNFFEKLGMRRPANTTELRRELCASTLIDRSLELLRDGYSPSIVVIGKEFKVIPDFLLSSAVGYPHTCDQPVLVLPLRGLLLSAFENAETKLPKESKHTPSMEIIDHTEKKPRKRRYHHKGQWGFELEE
jgi:hypothetical protein